MNILAVELRDFRNLAAVLVEPHGRMNVLAGDNGQGKTNFIEALFLVGTLRAFRAQRSDELVRFGATDGLVRARVGRRGLERHYEVLLVGHPAQKRARVDGKAVRAADYFGGFNVVLFAPEDLRLLKGPPSERRRFLDRAVWNAEASYLADAQTFERVLKSRNALLRAAQHGRFDVAQLEVYDAQLAASATRVVERRRRYLDVLAPLVVAAHARITSAGHAVELRYAGELLEGGPEGYGPRLLAALVADRGRDRERGHTHAGPHSDDLEVLLDGRPARAHASQGQTRAIVLALKIAEIEHLAETLGEPPILLLDDVSSELDATRTAQLFEFVAGLDCQTFLTTTAPGSLPLPADRRDFQVNTGDVRA